MSKKKLNKMLFVSILLFVCLQNVSAQGISDQKISGTIFFNNESYLHFDDILYIHGFIAPTSRLNRYKAFKILYKNSIRVISIYNLKYIRIDAYETGIGQEGEEVIKNLSLRVETKNRLVFEMPYFELSWLLVLVEEDTTKLLLEKRVPFMKKGELNIQKIVFD